MQNLRGRGEPEAAPPPPAARPRRFDPPAWSCKSLVHDYRPCFDRLTGISGLYDVVDGVFFPNAAGKHFMCGKKKGSGSAIVIR